MRNTFLASVARAALLFLTPAVLVGCRCTPAPAVVGPVTVQVWLNGKGPYLFGTDSGASGGLYVSPELAQDLGLPVIDQIQASDGNSDRAQTLDVVRVDRFEAAGVRQEALPAVVIGRGPGTPQTLGFVGFEYFRQHLLTVDLTRSEIRAAEGNLSRADGKRVLKFTADRGTPHIPISLAGVKMEAHLDTGADGPLMLPREWIEKLPLKAPPVLVGRMATLFGEEDLYEARLDGDLRIGSIRRRDPLIRFSDLLGFPNLGRDVLAGCTLTFDQRRDLVRIDPPACDPD